MPWKKYPLANNWLEYRRTDDGAYEVTDVEHKRVYAMGTLAVRFLQSLDGHTDPCKANPAYTSEEADSFLKYLDRHRLLRHGRLHDLRWFGTLFYTIWIPTCGKKLARPAKIMADLLNLLFLPLLVVSVLVFLHHPQASGGFLFLGMALGLGLGLILHEMAHAMAGFAANARVQELGLTLRYFLPGAYAMVDSASVKSRWKRIRIFAAGIEMNIFLAAVCLLLTQCLTAVSAALFMAALTNLMLAALNLTIIDGLDGAAILSELLGVEGIVNHAKQAVFSKKTRRRLLRRGAPGWLEVLCCVGVLIAQISLPILHLINILSIGEGLML